MTEPAKKGLLAAGALMLLLPLTLVTALLAALSYPAYPIPDPGALQILFDAGMALQAGALAAAWYLTILYLRRGRRGVGAAHPAWTRLIGAGAVIGLVGAGIAAEHMMTPRTAGDHVGFALLSPAALLVPVWLFMRRERRGAGRGASVLHQPPAG